MRELIGLAVLAALAATAWAAPPDAAGRASRSESNNAGGIAAAPSGCTADGPCDSGLSFALAEDAGAPPVAVSRVDFAPVSGGGFSACDISCPAGVPARQSDSGAGTGPGQAVVHFATASGNAPSAHMTLSGFCPATDAAVSPVKGVGVVIKHGGGRGAEYRLAGATVTACDAGSATISYAAMAINEKGLPGTRTPKGATTR